MTKMSKTRTEGKRPENPIERLYAGPIDDFPRARDAFAKELAAAGDDARAKGVKALRRPTVSAWGGERLAREARGGRGALLGAADRVRGAKGDALREAVRGRA